MTSKVLKRIAVILAAGSTIFYIQLHQQKQIKDVSSKRTLEQLSRAGSDEVSQLSLVREAPNLGFGNVVANTIFIRFLHYFGSSEERAQIGYGSSSNFFKAILQHDKSHTPYYLFLSGSNTLYAGDPEETVRIMDDRLSNLTPNHPPDGYYIWRYKAVDELLFVGNSKAAQRSFSTAASWAQQSNDSNAELIGQLSRKTARFLADNPSSRIAQIDAWSSLLTTALDPEIQTRAMEKIESLGGSVLISESGEISIRYKKAEGTDSNNNSDI